MDPYLLTFAGTAGSSLVTLLVTDGWQQAKGGVVSIWRRFRPEAAEEVEQELEVSRRSLLTAAVGGEDDLALNLASHWRRRVAELIGEHPDAAVELSQLIAWSTEEPSGRTIKGGARLEANASGNARIYQSVGDQHINDR
ncbi:hypothetical protein ACFVIM_13390 [Streptomyces sp. NPDC057638]|uniref:hypothetical protein n=1 Tax=Streptomyces sp. NPDC057638 TaxID=3346190 RepID=UPI003697F188